MSSKWHGTGRLMTVSAAVGTAVLAGASAVLVASASGALRPHSAEPPASHAGAVPAASTPGAPAAVLSRSTRRTTLTHLPIGGVTDGTRGVAIRLNGDPAAGTPRPRLLPYTAGRWTDVGDYEFFRPASTLEPCASYKLTIPAATVAAGHRKLGHARTVSFTVACPGITAVQEALARLNYLPYALHGFVGASSVAPLTRVAAARRAFNLPDGILRANVRAAPPLTMGKVDPTTTGAMEVFEEDHGLPLSTTRRSSCGPSCWRTRRSPRRIRAPTPG